MPVININYVAHANNSCTENDCIGNKHADKSRATSPASVVEPIIRALNKKPNIPDFFRSMAHATWDGASMSHFKSMSLITTGGTIGAERYPCLNQKPNAVYQVNPPEYADMLKHSPIPRALQLTMPGLKYELTELPPMDSQHLKKNGQEGLNKLLASIDNSIEKGHQAIVVTIGTDGMAQTGYEIKKALSKKLTENKTAVVLTGAMTPLANTYDSDGFSNLSKACMRAQHAEAGIHISMENIFNLAKDSVVKDKSREDQRYYLSLV